MKRFIVCISTPQRTSLLGESSASAKIAAALNRHYDLENDNSVYLHTIKQRCKLVIVDLDTEVHNSDSELSSDLRKIFGSIVEDIVTLEI